jgi:MscS family membrane protein
MSTIVTLPWWPWVAIPGLLLVAYLVGTGLGKLSRMGLSRVAARTAVTWDDTLVARIGGPLTVAWTLLIMSLALPFLELAPRVLSATQRGIRTGFILTFFWGLWRAIDVVRLGITESKWIKEHASASSLVPLLGKVGKVLVLVFGVVTMLSELGYPVASIVAGLGIGGLAVALAARSTLENLFGAFSIAADRPFREGDFVKIDDFVGTVESIGLRSTRVRTLDRTLISLPNGKLVDMKLESFAARDRIRLSCVVNLVYSTTAAQMRAILAGFEAVLRAHPQIWPDAVVVRFRELASSSLDIEVMAWFQTQDFSVFTLIRQDILLQFMEVVEKAGSSFAFPTRTVHLASDGEAPRGP